MKEKIVTINEIYLDNLWALTENLLNDLYDRKK